MIGALSVGGATAVIVFSSLAGICIFLFIIFVWADYCLKRKTSEQNLLEKGARDQPVAEGFGSYGSRHLGPEPISATKKSISKSPPAYSPARAHGPGMI